MRKKVVIFDLDGTILDTLKDLQMAVNFALSHFDYPMRTLDQVRRDIGNGVAKLIERSIPGGISNQNYDKCLEIFKISYRENYDVNTAFSHSNLLLFNHLLNCPVNIILSY